MPHPSTPVLTAPQISRLYEQTLAAEYFSWVQAWIARHPGSGFVARRLAGTPEAPAVCVAGPGRAIVNETLGIGFDEYPPNPQTNPQTDPASLIAAIKQTFQDAGSDKALVELSPYADPRLAPALAAAGFVYDHSLHVAFREQHADASNPSAMQPPAGVTVRTIDKHDPAEVERAARIIAAGKTSVDRTGEIDPDALTIARQVASCHRVATFIASIEGHPAGAASAGIHEGHPLSPRHLNLYGAATLPAFRRRGVQRALLIARLAWADRAGITSASLDFRPGVATERTIPHLGFRMIYTKPVLTKRLTIVS